MEGNLFSYLVLLLWPPWAMVAFYFFRPSVAVMLVLTAGSMFLPVGVAIDAPAIPPLDKESLPPVAALLASLVFARHRLRGSKPFRGIELLAVLSLLGAIVTTFTNREPLVYGPTVIPGLTLYDLLASGIKLLLRAWLPFYLGRTLFRTTRDLRDLMVGLATAGLVYSLFILIEIRLSPQFHAWFYGFYQHQFAQSIRYGGYRPMVFMRHGLNVALFMILTTVAATALARLRLRVAGVPARLAAPYLGVILVMCKSISAIVYGLLALPLVALASVKRQRQVSVLLAAIIIGYPAMRLAGILPVDDIVEFFSNAVDEQRAGSLAFRLETEEAVLDRAAQKLVFGWGEYARGFIWSEETGKMTSIVDGLWVIEVTTWGLVGFVSLFGLLLYPVYQAWRLLPKISLREERTLLSALALLVAFYVFDLVPNSSIACDLTMVCGALHSLVPATLKRQRALERRRRANESSLEDAATRAASSVRSSV